MEIKEETHAERTARFMGHPRHAMEWLQAEGRNKATAEMLDEIHAMLRRLPARRGDEQGEW